jgi:protein-disulfide isomerase
MMTPAVFVNGEAKIVGRVPSPNDIKKILQKTGA